MFFVGEKLFLKNQLYLNYKNIQDYINYQNSRTDSKVLNMTENCRKWLGLGEESKWSSRVWLQCLLLLWATSDNKDLLTATECESRCQHDLVHNLYIVYTSIYTLLIHPILNLGSLEFLGKRLERKCYPKVAKLKIRRLSANIRPLDIREITGSKIHCARNS